MELCQREPPNRKRAAHGNLSAVPSRESGGGGGVKSGDCCPSREATI